jgi:threonine dehydrogenase-like Zn-dependent dehydrogenase
MHYCYHTLQGDIILRVTKTAICGSDLHLYLRGMPGMKAGDVLGHVSHQHMLAEG